MFNKDCINKALEALPSFSAEDLKNYASRIFAERRDSGIPGREGLKQAQAVVNKQVMDNFYEDAQVKLNNIAKVNLRKADIESGKANARDLFVRDPYSNRNFGNNVESAQRSAIDQLSRSFFDELTPEEFAYFRDPKNQEEIINVSKGKRGSPQASKIVNQLNKYIDARNAEMVNSNAMTLENLQTDRFLKANHDASKLMAAGRSLIQAGKSFFKYDQMAAKQRWINTIKPRINLEKTFSLSGAIDKDGNIDMDRVDDILGRTFDNITTGKTEIFTKSSVTTDKDAIRKKSHMFFHWNDLGDFAAYNKEYGTGDLFSAVMADIHGSGNKIGMSRFLGENPYSAFITLEKAQQAVDPKSKGWWDQTGHCFQEVMGTNKIVVSPALATFFGNIRAWTGMSRLGSLVLSSTTDANIAASYARRWGVNYGKALANQFDTVFRQYSDEEKQYIGKLFHANLQSHIGYMGKMIDAQNLSGFTSKVSSLYYKATGMHTWDSGNRIGIMHMMAMHLAEMSNKSMDALSDDLRVQLNKFNITSDEWNALRKQNQNGLFTTDNVNSLSQDEIKELHAKAGNPNMPLYEYRNDLYRKVSSMFDVASQNAILTPGAFEKAFMLQGTKPGTWKGEALRTFMQFKGFPLSYINRVLVQGWKDADGVQAKLGWALSNFGYILPFSYVSTMMYYLGQGQSMPDPEEMNFNDNLNFWAGIAMPGIGSLSMILDKDNQNQNLINSLMTTPSWRFINNALSAPLSLVTGNPETSLKDTKNAGQYIMPGMTAPIISPYIKSFLGDKPYLQPGQAQLYGA